MNITAIPDLAHTNMLETPRLLIRIDTEHAYKNAIATGSDEALKAQFGFTTEQQIATERAKVADGLTTYRTSLIFFHLIEQHSKVVVGAFSFHNWFPMHQRSEIGYAMKDDAYKNKGYMKEAFPLILQYGFEVMNLNRMEAFIHPENTPSKRLVAGNGFTGEGLLRDHFAVDGVLTDSLVYGLLRREYNQRMR